MNYKIKGRVYKSHNSENIYYTISLSRAVFEQSPLLQNLDFRDTNDNRERKTCRGERRIEEEGVERNRRETKGQQQQEKQTMAFLKLVSGHLLGWTLIRSLSNIELGLPNIESVRPHTTSRSWCP